MAGASGYVLKAIRGNELLAAVRDVAARKSLLARTDYGRVATSMRALPFLALARHVVDDGRVLLRLPGNCGYHRACAGGVVAYGADNLGSARPGAGLWSVQVVGECSAYEPTAAELDRFV
ncbi:hypothetical protein QF037_004725 [Streptomyces canus]|nr:hypothetical protein [Streptomyces canus]